MKVCFSLVALSDGDHLAVLFMGPGDPHRFYLVVSEHGALKVAGKVERGV